jgi:hypothetical protein
MRSKYRLKDLDYLAHLLDPEFLHREDGLFFMAHFTESDYETYWREKIRQNKEKTERTINHVHLSDLVDDFSYQKELGEKIVEVWQKKVRETFPKKRVNIILQEGYRDSEKEWIIEMWSA